MRRLFDLLFNIISLLFNNISRHLLEPIRQAYTKNMSIYIKQELPFKQTKDLKQSLPSLRGRIFFSIFGISALMLILSLALLVVALDEVAKKQTFANLKAEADKLILQMQSSDYINFWGNYPYRITLVDINGNVLYDNRLTPSLLSNHETHEEIKQAIDSKNSATAIRFSQSLNQNALYYAIFLKQYNLVLRVSTNQDTLYNIHFSLLPYVAIIALIALVVSLFIAHFLTLSIVSPINRVDLLDNSGNFVSPYMELFLFTSKITAQKKKIKKQLKKIQRQQLELQTISQNIDEGFILLDAKKDIVSFNNKALKMLPTLIKGTNAMDIECLNRLFNATFENTNNALKPTLDSGEIISLNNANVISSQPHILSIEQEIKGMLIEMISLPIWRKNKPRTYIVLLLDRSKKNELERLRKEFSANVTHELKTPLSVIMASSEMMKNNMVLQSDLPEFANKIFLESKRLLDIINDILKLAFFDEGNVLNKSNIKLCDVVKRAINALLEVAKQKQIRIEVKEEYVGEMFVFGVENLLEDMVYNLCENAIKYNVEKGSIEVILKGKGSEKILIIKDSGIGIPPQAQERVFERFYCVDKSRSKKFGGTGLGLSIVKHIAEYHNANIYLESEVGKGSKFTIRF